MFMAFSPSVIEMNIPHPHIISESGRFIVAQSSLLVFDVVDRNLIESEGPIVNSSKSAAFFTGYVGYLSKPSQHFLLMNPFNDLVEKKRDIYQLFVYNVLSLKDMALAERIYWKARGPLKRTGDRTAGL